MCEALYNQNKTLLSAVESISAVALSAAVTDYYNDFERRARLAASQSQSRSRSQSQSQSQGQGRASPSTSQQAIRGGGGAGGAGLGKPPMSPRVGAGAAAKGRRTPRKPHSREDRLEIDVLEMGASALVLMSPAKKAAGIGAMSGEDDDDGEPGGVSSHAAFASPSASPARATKKKPGSSPGGRVLFPPGSPAAKLSQQVGLDGDEDALGALDGLFMLADASQEQDRVVKPARGKSRKPDKGGGGGATPRGWKPPRAPPSVPSSPGGTGRGGARAEAREDGRRQRRSSRARRGTAGLWSF